MPERSTADTPDPLNFRALARHKLVTMDELLDEIDRLREALSGGSGEVHAPKLRKRKLSDVPPEPILGTKSGEVPARLTKKQLRYLVTLLENADDRTDEWQQEIYDVLGAALRERGT